MFPIPFRRYILSMPIRPYVFYDIHRAREVRMSGGSWKGLDLSSGGPKSYFGGGLGLGGVELFCGRDKQNLNSTKCQSAGIGQEKTCSSAMIEKIQ